MPGKSQELGGGRGELLSRLRNGAATSPKQLALADLADAPQIYAMIQFALENGAAIMFGRTSDGGALVVTLYLDGQRFKHYAATSAEWDQILDLLGR